MQTMSRLDVSSILAEEIDWKYKGFPPTAERVTIGSVGEQRWHALDGDLLFPLLLVKESALDHNIRLMASFCQQHGVSLAPHGKTPIAPQIVQRQLEVGAWGITAANLHQARIFRAFGAQRILIANEVLEPIALEWIAGEMARDPELQILFLVDSAAGARTVARVASDIAPARPLSVLLEWGSMGARAGIRDAAVATECAALIHQSPHIQLCGVEGYEGSVGGQTFDERLHGVDRFLNELRAITTQLHDAGMFETEEIIVTAGGSLFMDRVVAVLGGQWSLSTPVRVVLRSGAYVGHDADEYERWSGLAGRASGAGRLQPVLEVWGLVLSCPEPGLAIVGFGKRDVSYDIHLPIPFAVRRDGAVRPARDLSVTKVNDQHAYAQVGAEEDLAVGDLVGCHISHACTAFDKWRLLPLVDHHYRVTGAIRTFF